MRAQSFSYANAQLVWCLTVTLSDGTVIRGCEGTNSLPFEDGTFVPLAGLKVGDCPETNDGTPPSRTFDVAAVQGGPFDPADIDNDRFSDAEVLLEKTDAANPVSRDFSFSGVILGKVAYDPAGRASFEALSRLAWERDVFIRPYQYPCDARFGDYRCKMATFPGLNVGSIDLHDIGREETLAVGDRRRFDFDETDTPDRYHNVWFEVTGITTGITASSAPSYSDTPDDVITDGGVTLTVRNALARAARVGTIINSRSFLLTDYDEPRANVNDWLMPGRIWVRSGYCKNRVAKIIAFVASSGRIQLEETFAELMTEGDWLEVAPDCTNLPPMCDAKHDNMNNYRGKIHGTGGALAWATIVDGTTVMPGPTDDPVSAGGGGGDGDALAVEFLAGAD